MPLSALLSFNTLRLDGLHCTATYRQSAVIRIGHHIDCSGLITRGVSRRRSRDLDILSLLQSIPPATADKLKHKGVRGGELDKFGAAGAAKKRWSTQSTAYLRV